MCGSEVFPLFFWKFLLRRVNLFFYREICLILSISVSVLTNLGIHVSANDENVVFRDTTSKRGLLIIKGDEFIFFTDIGRAVAGDDCCAGVAIKSSYHHPRLYFLYAIMWFRARGSINIPTPPIVELTDFFHADAAASVNPLPESWYLISSLWVYLRFWMHIMSMLWSMVDTVSSGCCPILFKVLTLNLSICIVRLHFSNFC